MMTCPNCKYEEYTGALFCSECGTSLVEKAGITTHGLESVPAGFSAPAGRAIAADPVPVSDNLITLHFFEKDVFLPLQPRDGLLLGRINEGQKILPDVDLSNLGGYELGVSRIHAALHIMGEEITIRDLGSANGTRINGEKLVPQEHHALRSGDILTLGKLRAQVIIRGG